MRYLIAILILLFSSPVIAADIYVDTTLGGDCTGGDYSTSSRTCTGSDGNAYNTIMEAVDAMNGGDDIFLRGGTYQQAEIGGSYGSVRLKTSDNGTDEGGDNLFDDSWSSIQSYPNEWAKIDAENKGTRQPNTVLGLPAADHDRVYDLQYWKFERLELTGGTNLLFPGDGGAHQIGGSSSGLWANGGPFIARYLYIHDNIATSSGENPGGLVSYQPFNSVIEYCYLKDNGSNVSAFEQHSTAGIIFYSAYNHTLDYFNQSDSEIAARLPYEEQKNSVRYNYIESTNDYNEYGIFGKGRTYLDNTANPQYTYKDYGDKIHHNIVVGTKIGINSTQQYQQVYNNIVHVDLDVGNVNRSGMAAWTHGLSGSPQGNTLYNNTIINGRLTFNFGYNNDGYSANNGDIPFLNNLLASPPTANDNSNAITLGNPYMDASLAPNTSRFNVNNNYTYDPPSSTQIRVARLSGTCYQDLSLSAYDTCYSALNYSKASSEGTDNLFTGSTGAGQYITRSTHTIGTGITIADGGVGGAHPYLSGVTIPSYIGATNPDDNAWVAGVIGLDDTYMTSAVSDSDPTWIEGAVAVSSGSMWPYKSPTGAVWQATE